jgi:PelA/Pel-15E family pectate lyase
MCSSEFARKPAPTPADQRGRINSSCGTPPLWARFYEIGTNRPIFSDRDGVPKRELSEIGYERRNGYAWLGKWPQHLLAVEYPAWRHKLNLSQ